VTIFVILGIIAIVAVFVMAFAWDGEEAVAPTINQGNTNTIFENINATLESDPTEDMTEEEISEAEERDIQRLEDINLIKTVLDDFVEINGYYPDAIDELVPEYFTELPADPMPENYEYSYTCIGSLDPCLYYDLSYTLEVGTEDVPAGLNLESPDEIATP